MSSTKEIADVKAELVNLKQQLTSQLPGQKEHELLQLRIIENTKLLSMYLQNASTGSMGVFEETIRKVVKEEMQEVKKEVTQEVSKEMQEVKKEVTQEVSKEMQEVKKEVTQEVSKEMQEVKKEMQEVSKEMQEVSKEMQEVKKGVSKEMQEVKKEVTQEVSKEMQEVKKGVSKEMQEVKKEVTQEVSKEMQEVKQEVSKEMQEVKKEVTQEVQEIKEAMVKDLTVVSSGLNSTHFDALAISSFEPTVENILQLCSEFEITESNILAATQRISLFANNVVELRESRKYEEKYSQQLSIELVKDLLSLSMEEGYVNLRFTKNSNDVKFNTNLNIDGTLVKVSGERDMALLDPLSGLCLWSWEDKNLKIRLSAESDGFKAYVAQATTQVKAAMEAFKRMNSYSSLRMTGFLVSGTEFVLILGSETPGFPITFSKSLSVAVVREDETVDADACKIVGLMLLYSFEQFKFLRTRAKALSVAGLAPITEGKDDSEHDFADDEDENEDEEGDRNQRKPEGGKSLSKNFTKLPKKSSQYESTKKSIGILTERNRNVMIPITLSLENIKEHSMHSSYVSSFW